MGLSPLKARLLVLILILMFTSSCNQQVMTTPIVEPITPVAAAAPVHPRQISPVIVRIGDADNRPNGGGVIRSVNDIGPEFTYLAWGDEVWIDVIVAGDRLIADDLHKRIHAIPETDYSVQVMEQTDERHFRITLNNPKTGDTAFHIAAQPTMDKAPVFAQDLHYTIRKVDEPTFDIRCQEHPEIHYGPSLAIAPGLKHFTMTFTQPVPKDAANEGLARNYNARDITWMDNRTVTFTVEMKSGDKLTFISPTQADTRGLPFARLYMPPEIWTVEPRTAFLISGPDNVEKLTTLDTLTVGIALSPDAEYAVIAQETPIFYDLWRYGSISLVHLNSGQKTPLVDQMVFRGSPTQGVLWQPDGQSFWLVDRVGHAEASSGPNPALVVRLIDLTGNSRVITMELSDGQTVRGAAVSPIDGSLAVGIVQYDGQNSGYYPYSLRTYSPDGVFIKEYSAGWVQSQNPTLRSDLTYAIDGGAVYLGGGFIPDDQGKMQKGIMEVNLSAGSTKLWKASLETNRTSSTGMYLAATTQYQKYTLGVFLPDGQLVADLGELRWYAWSPDGKQLAYLDINDHLVVFDTMTKQSFTWLKQPIEKILGWYHRGVLVVK